MARSGRTCRTFRAPPAPVQNATLARRVAPVAESDDFKEVLRTRRARYPVRREGGDRAPPSAFSQHLRQMSIVTLANRS